MRIFSKISILVFLAFFLVAGSAIATPINLNANNGEDDLQTIFNDMTVGGESSIDVENDQVSPDAVWERTDSDIGSASMIIELAGYAGSNVFGIYDQNNTDRKVELFNGSATAGTKVSFTVVDTPDGEKISVFNWNTGTGKFSDAFSTDSFGFYLGVSGGSDSTTYYYSDTADNIDGADHMLAFQGVGDRIYKPGNPEDTIAWTNGGHILAWEDLSSDNWDYDYNDMVLIVESVQPVPEPATLLLLGSGLLGLAGLRRRNAKK